MNFTKFMVHTGSHGAIARDIGQQYQSWRTERPDEHLLLFVTAFGLTRYNEEKNSAKQIEFSKKTKKIKSVLDLVKVVLILETILSKAGKDLQASILNAVAEELSEVGLTEEEIFGKRV